MKFKPQNGVIHGIVALPADVVDKHIKNASGAFFKVLLVLLRNDKDGITSEDIEKMTGIAADQVDEAALYWARNLVIPESMIDKELASLPSKTVVEPVSLTAKEIRELINSDSQISFMFQSIESIFARPVTATEQKVFVSMREWLGMPVEVILMLVSYCVSIDKTSVRYMEKMAAGWCDEGIVTYEAAEQKLKQLKYKNSVYGKIKTAFGIYERKLTTKEQKFIDTWTDGFGFNIGLIKLAYERCVDNTGKLSFPYINKILSDWHSKGYKTAEDVSKDVQKPVAGKIILENSSYDLNEFENIGIYDIPKKGETV